MRRFQSAHNTRFACDNLHLHACILYGVHHSTAFQIISSSEFYASYMHYCWWWQLVTTTNKLWIHNSVLWWKKSSVSLGCSECACAKKENGKKTAKKLNQNQAQWGKIEANEYKDASSIFSRWLCDKWKMFENGIAIFTPCGHLDMYSL